MKEWRKRAKNRSKHERDLDAEEEKIKMHYFKLIMFIVYRVEWKLLQKINIFVSKNLQTMISIKRDFFSLYVSEKMYVLPSIIYRTNLHIRKKKIVNFVCFTRCFFFIIFHMKKALYVILCKLKLKSDKIYANFAFLKIAEYTFLWATGGFFIL